MTDNDKLECLDEIEEAGWDQVTGIDAKCSDEITMTQLDLIERCQRIRAEIQSSIPWPMSIKDQEKHAQVMLDFPEASCLIPKGRCPVCR